MKRKSIAKMVVGLACVSALALALAGCGSSSSSGGSASDSSAAAGSASAESASASESTGLSGTVSTNGSTSMEKVIGSLSEAFMAENPDVTITYDATGSGTGIESAKNGSADIGLASRALKSEETGLESVTVALDGIAIVVNADNGVKDLTLDQISQIFKGEITNWSEVGGDDLEISCIGRESGSGTRDGFESITGTEDACKLDQELTSTGAVISAVAGSPNAIGYASLSAVEGQDGINAVTVDGVECSEDTVLDGSYQIQRPFNLILPEDAQLSDAAQAFVDFATSDDAASLIRDAGAVPVSDQAGASASTSAAASSSADGSSSAK